MNLALSSVSTDARPRAIVALALYLPFIVGLFVVVSSTYVLELVRSSNGNVMTHELMNAFMGFFFIIFALPKFLNLSGFVENFRQYDVISKRFAFYAKTYPFVELSLGVLLVSNYPTNSLLGNRLANVCIAVIAGIGVFSVVRALRQDKQPDCACIGSAFKLPLSKVTIIENGLMFLMAVSMLLTYSPDHMTMISLTHFGILAR